MSNLGNILIICKITDPIVKQKWHDYFTNPTYLSLKKEQNVGDASRYYGLKGHISKKDILDSIRELLKKDEYSLNLDIDFIDVYIVDRMKHEMDYTHLPDPIHM